MARTVTRAGPITKIISSTTDSSANAESSAGVPPSSALQRVRTIEPREGIDEPAMHPVTSSTQTGAPELDAGDEHQAAAGEHGDERPEHPVLPEPVGKSCHRGCRDGIADGPGAGYQPSQPVAASTGRD